MTILVYLVAGSILSNATFDFHGKLVPIVFWISPISSRSVVGDRLVAVQSLSATGRQQVTVSADSSSNICSARYNETLAWLFNKLHSHLTISVRNIHIIVRRRSRKRRNIFVSELIKWRFIPEQSQTSRKPVFDGSPFSCNQPTIGRWLAADHPELVANLSSILQRVIAERPTILLFINNNLFDYYLGP